MGVHMPEMLSSRGNCAVCSKKIRMSHKNDFKDVPKVTPSSICATPKPKHILQGVQCIPVHPEGSQLLGRLSFLSRVLEIE